jgi:hypothetical protein
MPTLSLYWVAILPAGDLNVSTFQVQEAIKRPYFFGTSLISFGSEI